MSSRRKSPTKDFSVPVSQDITAFNKFQRDSSIIRSRTGRQPPVIIIRREDENYHKCQSRRLPSTETVTDNTDYVTIRSAIENDETSTVENGLSDRSVEDTDKKLINTHSKTLFRAIKSFSSHILRPKPSILKKNEDGSPIPTDLKEMPTILSENVVAENDVEETVNKVDDLDSKTCPCPKRISFKFGSKKVQATRNLVNKGVNYHIKTFACGTQYVIGKVKDQFTSPDPTHIIITHNGTMTDKNS